MRPALSAIGTVSLFLWWVPTVAADALAAVPHLAAALGTGRRLARVHRLIARGDLDEAERVVDALHRERGAAER